MDEPRAIISLTTHGKRAPLVGRCIDSLLRVADELGCRVNLAVSRETEASLPASVRELAAAGRFDLLVSDADYGSNMKWIPARQKNPCANLICLDDDRLYSADAISGLLAAAEKHPGALLCYAWRRLCVKPDGSTARWTLSRLDAEYPRLFVGAGPGVVEPVELKPGTFVAEHWAACLHPPCFGLGSEFEASVRAHGDDDVFVTVHALRTRTPCFAVPSPKNLAFNLSKAGTEEEREVYCSTALGLQRRSGWDRTAGVMEHYEPVFAAARNGFARNKPTAWDRFPLHILITCAGYPVRRERALAECNRVGLSVEELECPHLATEGLSDRTCPDESVLKALRKTNLGAAACLIAHRSAMLRLLSSPFDSMLVLEDDVRFLNDVDKLSEYVRSIPDDYSEARLSWGGSRYDATHGKSFGGGLWHQLLNRRKIWSSAAYVITRECAEAFLEAFEGFLSDDAPEPLPCDLLVQIYGDGRKIYIASPPCATQAFVKTGIEEGANNKSVGNLLKDIDATGSRAEDFNLENGWK